MVLSGIDRKLPVLGCRFRLTAVWYRGRSTAALSEGHGGLAQLADDDLALQGSTLVCEHKTRSVRLPERGSRQWRTRDAQRRVADAGRLRAHGTVDHLNRPNEKPSGASLKCTASH